MTEKDKMLRGEWHDANFDDALLRERRNAELLCYEFNMAKPGSDEQNKTNADRFSVGVNYLFTA